MTITNPLLLLSFVNVNIIEMWHVTIDNKIDDFITVLSSMKALSSIKIVLLNIKENNNNYMGTVITLSNHTPFENNDKFEQIDLTKSAKVYNEITGKYEITGFVDGKPNDYYCITILDEFGRSGSTAYIGEKVIFENYKNSNMI